MPRRALLAGPVLALLCACGQKGALYLPGEEAEAVMSDPVSIPTPTPPSAPAATPAPPPADAAPAGASTDERDGEGTTRRQQ